MCSAPTNNKQQKGVTTHLDAIFDLLEHYIL